MSKINVPFVFRVCESPLCTSKIWADGFKYKSGRFCDKYCEEDYNLSSLNKKPRTEKQIAQVARMHDAKHGADRPGRNIDMLSDDYKFEFNPKTI